MNITCFIIDDEPLAIEVLESHIANIEELEVIGKFDNAISAFQALQKNAVDLIFLDVQMPKLSGIDFLKSLVNPPKVILTTAYRDYALAGFELDVVDYLLKPISFERFLQAIGKVYAYRTGRAKAPEAAEEEAYLYVQTANKTSRIMLEDILYLESQRDYVKIMTAAGPHTIHEKTSALEERLRQRDFVRIHRSFIVPLNKVDSWSANELEIRGHTLPIGRTFSQEVLRLLKARMEQRGV